MLNKKSIDRALTLVIPAGFSRDMNLKDCNNLMKSYGIMEQAKDSLLNREITPDEYFSLCEQHNVNVDSYMESIEHNLMVLGVT